MKVPPPERPSAELRYEDPDYLDRDAVERELRRTAEVCHQCRRCLPLCPSFPKLFELVDAGDDAQPADAGGHEVAEPVDAGDDKVAGVSMQGFEQVNELCYHCKLCYNHCPYTPPHEWDIDFPALMRRHQLLRAKRDGVPLSRKLTTRTDLIGKLASLAPPLMNFANRNRTSREMMEKTLGIHRDWVQPSYYHETVERWWKRRGPKGDGRQGKVVLFTTCSVNYSDPLVGQAAVQVLERSGVRVDVVYGRCCGMPFTDVGDLDSARHNARANVADLLPHVDDGALVLAPGPSCSLMLKEEYPRLLESGEARRVAAATRDLMEHVYDLARAKALNRDFTQRVGRVAYHAPCHLRAQNVGFRSRDLLRLVADDVELIDACSGVDGTWGMQARFHADSMKVASRLLGEIERLSPDHVATDCPLSALRIEEGTGRKAVHPIVLLRAAYGMGEP